MAKLKTKNYDQAIEIEKVMFLESIKIFDNRKQMYIEACNRSDERTIRLEYECKKIIKIIKPMKVVDILKQLLLAMILKTYRY